MITFEFPDGKRRHFGKCPTGLEVARELEIEDALIVRLRNKDYDLRAELPQGGRLEFVRRSDERALEILRHDCAHVLAEAVQELFEGTLVTFGPAIEDGFYYDFFNPELRFTPEHFPVIEEKMREIVDRNEKFVQEIWPREKAIEFFESRGEKFKSEHIKSIPKGEQISIYRQGDWTDLCRGPHMDSVGMVGKAFKLLSVAGAHWKGDTSSPALQRIYGTCWRTEKELNAYIERRTEAEKRDHRKIGKEMQIFHTQSEAAGSIFWHPKGWCLYRTCEAYMRRQNEADEYVEVKTPQLLDRALWERSGHWEKYRENMFVFDHDRDNRTLALKPMNCPGHVQIFRQGIKSWRDLPIRISEFGQVHRDEASGALLGMFRVRAFTQDDAHIFCTEEQIISEAQRVCRFMDRVYRDFGFRSVQVMFSDRPEIRAGEDAVWDRAEKALRDATKASGLESRNAPGEGAFYGPKLDFVLTDAIGRDWQCGTLQIDFVLPERLDANYIDTEGAKRRPVMIHRAVFGSLERFIGILIENYAGHFPLWLAPVQFVVLPVSKDFSDYAETVHSAARKAGLRTDPPDLRNEKIGYKIREHALRRVPVMAIIGKKEVEQRTVTLRKTHGGGGNEKQETLPLETALAQLREQALPPDIRREISCEEAGNKN